MEGNILCMLDDLEAPAMEAYNRGVKLSSITAKLKDSIDVTPLLGRFQQLGFVKIVYNPSVDDEPLVQITEKGKLQIIELLLSLQPTGK
ncbi:MAG: hypothetical protein NWE93_01420 [Candidatus Bathyarchaeota archaeon]|nr:hypothetical protein [Candidatus Bathyarchaeota archaeon]